MDKHVIDFLQSRGIKVIKEDIESKLKLWESWYKGSVDDFHTYKVYEGKKQLKKKRRTLNMAARVCQDWADLLLNERVAIKCSDENTQAVLDRLLEQVNFFVRGNNLIEAAFAKGGGFFIQFWDGDKVNQKYVTQDMMYPISYDSGRLTEAAFASETTIKSKKYIYLETHLKDENGLYWVENYLLEKENKSLKEVSPSFYEEIELEPIILTYSDKPLFQAIRPNVANKDKFDSPYGTSVFAGATDRMEAADIAFDSYVTEILLGRKRIFAHDGVTNKHYDENGIGRNVFDPNDEVFYLLPEAATDNAPPIIESNMQLRVADLDAALQTQLNLISQACGFGANGYKWESGDVSTATQIISENSKMFRTLKKHESVLRSAICDMAIGLLTVEALYNGSEGIDLNATITVDFDDSIIEDTAEIKRQAMLELNVGLIDPIEYYKRVYKYDDEQAEKFYNEMLARRPVVVEEPEGA